MKYVNKKTGAVIETACVISGDNWQVVNNQPNEKTKKPVKKSVKRMVNSDERNICNS